MLRPLTPEEGRRVVELYTSGSTLTAIAAELGRAHSTVRHHLVIVGVPRRPGGRLRTEVDNDEIVRLRDLGQGWDEVSRAVGLTAGGARTRYLRVVSERNPAGDRPHLHQRQNAIWARHWADVQDYYAQHGHWPRSVRAPEAPLVRWIGIQRRHFRSGTLAPARREQLERGGFPFEPVRAKRVVRVWRGREPVTDERLRQLVGLGATRHQIAENTGLSLPYVGLRLRRLRLGTVVRRGPT